MGRCCPELLHREAILPKSQLNHFPDCVRDIPEFLGDETSYFEEAGRERAPGIIQIQEAVVFS